jgi:hypothetical protein
MAIQNRTARIFLRRNIGTFRVSFFVDAANTIPMIPLDASLYPSYSIYDIHNNIVQSGVGQIENSPGSYKIEFQVPEDAPLSYDEKRWRIEWVMVDQDNRQVTFVEDFDVKDVAVTQSESREQKFITLCGQDYRAMVRLTSRPAELSLDVYMANSNCKVVDGIDLHSGIMTAPDGDSFVFYYDIPAQALGNNQNFAIIWKIRETVIDIQEFVYQTLTSIPPSTLNQVTAVRMLIDKFQKRLGVVQAYEDSDIVEYLQRGTELFNAVYPTTYWSFGSVPSSFNVWIVLFASWYALNAQRLLETDLGINFSGQTVTLDYDHQGPLADIMANWMEQINTLLPPAKLSAVRATRPVGTVAGRGYRYNALDAYTFKIGHVGGGANIIQTLTTLGILF